MVLNRSRLLALVSGSAWLLLGALELTATAVNGQGVNARVLQAVTAMTVSGFAVCLALFWSFGRLERKLRGGRLAAAAAAARRSVSEFVLGWIAMIAL